MTSHKDNSKFIEYLKPIIQELIEPLKTYTDKTDKNEISDQKWVSGYSELASDFETLGGIFALIDDDISEPTARFIKDTGLSYKKLKVFNVTINLSKLSANSSNCSFLF